MHRPLRVPFHLRIWHLIRGLLFYNTVYWRRASDGLNMPSLSAEERERQRPERNLEIIRPRVRPRAHIEVARGGEISHPPALTVPETLCDVPAEHPANEANAAPPVVRADETDGGTEQVYVKRRRYRRRLVSGRAGDDRDSFLTRVFRKR